MKNQKHLDDYSAAEIATLFVQDCIVPLNGNPPVPDYVVNQLMKLYCKEIGLEAPTKAVLTNVMRKYYAQIKKNNEVCYRAGLKPGLIKEDL